ncbi:MAG: hypothetical protein ABI227_13105 [Rhodanobacter sp.]
MTVIIPLPVVITVILVPVVIALILLLVVIAPVPMLVVITLILTLLILMLLLTAIVLILRMRHCGGSGKHQQCATDHPHIPLLVHDSSPLGMTRTAEPFCRDAFGEFRGRAIPKDRPPCQHYPCPEPVRA